MAVCPVGSQAHFRYALTFYEQQSTTFAALFLFD